MSNLDQTPDAPYGHCRDCNEEFADRAEMTAHLHESAAASPIETSHTAITTNPTRGERIESELRDLAESALDDFVSGADDLIIRSDVTEGEISEAVRNITGGFADAWAESLN